LREPGPQWTSIIDRMRATDSASASASDPVFHGAVHAYPVAGALAFVQSAYRWPAQGTPSLAHVTLLWADSIRTGPSLAQLGGAPTRSARAPQSETSTTFRTAVNAIYQRMRDAFRRGDFAAFGRALDDLGRLVGRTAP
jgi:uncharacterized membrane protein (UPF0182 family)